MKKAKLIRRGTSALLSLMMSVGLSFGALTFPAQAADSAQVTNKHLGVDVMANPSTPSNSELWNGSYVYYGSYTNTNSNISIPTLTFRVLNKNETAFGGSSLFLDGDEIIDGWNAKQTYEQALRGFLNGDFLTQNFTEQEQSAIMKSTKKGVGYDSALNGDKVFVLSETEARNTAYGYTKNWNELTTTQALTRTRPQSKNYHVFWLRTPNGNVSEVVMNSKYVDFLPGSIQLGTFPSGIKAGIVPAMNIERSKILFSNLMSGEAGTAGAKYKLTILDEKINVKDEPTAARDNTNEKEITVTYELEGKNKATANKLGLMVLNKPFVAGQMGKDDMVAYYEADASTNGEATATFTLDDTSDKSNLRYYLVPIVDNGGNKTDYAGTPIEVKVPALQTEAEYTIALNNGNATSDDVNKFGANGTVKALGVDEKTVFVYADYAFRDSGYTVSNKDDGASVGEDEVTVTRKYRVKDTEDWQEMSPYSSDETSYIFTVDNQTEYSKVYEIGYFIEEELLATRLVVGIFQKGDVNRDGKINGTDVAAVNLHAAGITLLELKDELYKSKTADVNGDDEVNGTDEAAITLHTLDITPITQDYASTQLENGKYVMTFTETKNSEDKL